MLSADPEIRRLMALRVIESGLLRLRWLAAATRFEIALRRHDRALKYAYKDEINSYFDPPKSLQELQDAANNPEKGYDIHHVVERNSAKNDGSEADLIDAPKNLVRVPQWKHWEINRWYEIPNGDFGRLTPRQYLKRKSWEERTRVGLDALRRVGVLRP